MGCVVCVPRRTNAINKLDSIILSVEHLVVSKNEAFTHMEESRSVVATLTGRRTSVRLLKGFDCERWGFAPFQDGDRLPLLGN